MSTIDFDAFRAEQKKEPLRLTLGGVTYDLPPSMPAALALDVARMHDKLGDDADVPTEELVKLGAGVFGGEAKFMSIIAEGAVTMDELPELMKRVIAAYSGVDPNSPAPKKGAKKKAPSTSSETGPS